MPKGCYDRTGIRFRHNTMPFISEPNQVFRPDISRGAERLTAEVLIAEHRGQAVPEFARLRARSILHAIAEG